MIFLGAFISLLIGIVLGLVGGGGSILTVPLVHYLFGTSMLLATTYSLIVVSVASGVGTLQRLKSKQVDFKQGLIFVLPSMTAAFVIRRFILPEIPESFEVAGFQMSLEIIIAILLIGVMLFTAIRTLISNRRPSSESATTLSILLFGILTGLLSGFIGAGGGFIIVPILIRLGMDIRKAVGTSMFIISIQSAIALMGDLFNPQIAAEGGIDWVLLLVITLFTVSGVLLGTYLQRYFSGKILRRVFSIILIAVALGILLQKLILN
ncbi:MAG: sulfite exporter TauE/SafE family protein [Crocinitomicaceae bacterium]|nr:sulfite exporter TauE/SafE family protein [Crocinitomicaceae bacterium]